MFLVDKDIKILASNGSITNIADLTSDPDGHGSPIQPCSLDLTIGKIYIPSTPPTESGSCDQPKSTHSLGPGETVVVETSEEFHLPNNIGGFGFPPTSVSNVGVLVTNLGHIDPGYDGNIRFTLVNMGHKHFSLNKGARIYTMLLFKLDSVPKKDFRSRHPNIDPRKGLTGVNQELLDSLSRDFLDVEKRAETAAQAAITIELRRPYITAITTVALALVTIVSSGIYNYMQVDKISASTQEIESKLKEEISELRKQLDSQKDFDNLKLEVERIKSLIQTETPPTKE